LVTVLIARLLPHLKISPGVEFLRILVDVWVLSAAVNHVGIASLGQNWSSISVSKLLCLLREMLTGAIG
jgi:hypothetical protein